MRTLIWKEWRENLKWIAIPGILLLGPMGFFGVPMLLEEKYLAYVSLVAALSGAVLGFLQVFAEARGDKRSLLLHRPLSPSRIFLAKVFAGVSLYLVSVLTPSFCAVGLAASPGHVAAPFEWRMALPWLADLLTGLVYYFAGMIAAQREARWYGSQFLPLAAGLFTSLFVWNVTEFWQALVAIGMMSALVAVAAWGSVVSGGTYTRQSRPARLALGCTLLLGLLTLAFGAKVVIGSEFLPAVDYYPFEMGRLGQVLVVQKENDSQDGSIQSITDLAGNTPLELAGERLDAFAFRKVIARGAVAGRRDQSISYRGRNRFLLEFKNETTPGTEAWWYVPAQKQMFGYLKQTKHLIGKFGPDGFVDPGQPVRGLFEGDPAFLSFGYEGRMRYPLAFPDGAFTVDFRKGSVQKLFAPPAGETVLWASQREDEREKWFHRFVGTEKALYVFDEAGKLVCSAPLPRDLEAYRLMAVGRLDRPRRYWIWYNAQWQLPFATQDKMPEGLVVIYDATGKEILPRQTVPPRPGAIRDAPSSHPLVRPSPLQPLFGLAACPVEVATLIGTTALLQAEARRHDGTEEPMPLQFLGGTSQLFIPGMSYSPHGHPGLVGSFAGLVLLASTVSGLVCYWLARRYVLARSQRIGWVLCGVPFGPTGVLLMVTLPDWPAQIACPACRRRRAVTREQCEHCGAPHAHPTLDGTEVFEADKVVDTVPCRPVILR
jgi:hypothetical protein